MRPSTITGAISCLAAATLAQSPTFDIAPAAALGPTGASIPYAIVGNAGQLYAVLISPQGGPLDVLGERLFLGPTPILTLRSGLLPGTGLVTGTISLPAGPAALGLAVYGQAIAADPTAPQGIVVSNGESSLVHGAPQALAIAFDDPQQAGFTGSFGQGVAGHITGGAITRRTWSVMPTQGVAFGSPVQNPLNPAGAREQMVFRSSDVGASGSPEMLTAIRWYSATPVVFDVFPHIDILVGHTPVTPDYSIDPWTALPSSPNSGLDPTFANNYSPSAPPQVVYSAGYVIQPSIQQPDGYVPLPEIVPFAYDGTSSLLIELRTNPGAPATGQNGMYGYLMVQSSPLPAARVVASGTPSQPLNPSQATMGTGDNLLMRLQFEFADVTTEALSPFFSANVSNPDWDPALVAATLPAGTGYEVEFRGATSNSGSNATAWSSSPNVADGLPHLQFRITFRSNAQTGEVPLIDTLVVPYR